MKTLLALVISSLTALAAKPNVIIVMTDDQGLGDFSCMGNPVLKTPNFDKFHKESVRLTDFHVAPMCSPTRGQLMTGLAALRNGATSVTAGRTFMRPGLPTMPESFAAAGYKTGLFGKWHLGDHYPHRPMDKGFQESVYHLGWGQLQSTPEFGYPLIDGRYFHNGEPKNYKGHCTDFWFDSAIGWMKKCQTANEPFFCYIPTNAPHAPCIDLDEYVKPYQKAGQPAGFFGMISHLDKRFGDLDKFLAESKLALNTIVIFMTDNGGTAGVKTFNAGLRAGKTTYYDGGHRVPCWIRGPEALVGKPRDLDFPAQNTDIFPTLCDLCGVPMPQRKDEDLLYRGLSFADFLTGKRTPEGTQRAFVVQYGQVPKKGECCVVWNQWRLVNDKELYDVKADRAQAKDLAAEHPAVLKTMREYYEKWWAGVEPMLSDFVPISLGGKQEVVELTSGDWENIYADNSGYVRDAVGGPTGGQWHILVEKEGEYEFALMRWPAQTKAGLGESYDPPAAKAGKSKSFPGIAKGQLTIAGVKAEAKADPKSNAVIVRAKLPAGKSILKAWFTDAEGKDQCGAFFVTVKKLP